MVHQNMGLFEVGIIQGNLKTKTIMVSLSCDLSYYIVFGKKINYLGCNLGRTNK
jgi:hypothetical protein